MSDESGDIRFPTDEGHRGDVDVTQILERLKLTPLERLEKHEEWKQAIRRLRRDARVIRPRSSSPVDGG